MFGLGPTELIIILVVAVLVFGPMRIPAIARSLKEAILELRAVGKEMEDERDES